MTEKNNRFDINSLIGNIKSIINPTGNTPNPDPEDTIGLKIAELSVMMQELQQAYSEQGQHLNKINKLFNEVYEHLQALRAKQTEKKSDASDTSNNEKS